MPHPENYPQIDENREFHHGLFSLGKHWITYGFEPKNGFGNPLWVGM